MSDETDGKVVPATMTGEDFSDSSILYYMHLRVEALLLNYLHYLTTLPIVMTSSTMFIQKDFRAMSATSTATLSVSAGRSRYLDQPFALLTKPLQGCLHPSLRCPILSQFNNKTVSAAVPRFAIRHPRQDPRSHTFLHYQRGSDNLYRQ